MALLEKLIILVLLLFFFYIVITVIRILFFRPRLHLSSKVKAKADWKFKKLLTQFKEEHNRDPIRDELFRIIINASHITIRRGHKGHWGRQKIRKYLLEKHNVDKYYVMR